MRATEMVRSVGSSVLKRVGRVASRFQEETGVPADVLEGDDEYLVVFDAPGATASDVQVRYRDDAVLVRIDRFREFREGFEMVFPGRGLALDGRAELPDDAIVDADHARAQLNRDGTLYVFLPKAEGGTDVAVGEPGLAEPTAVGTGEEAGSRPSGGGETGGGASGGLGSGSETGGVGSGSETGGVGSGDDSGTGPHEE